MPRKIIPFLATGMLVLSGAALAGQTMSVPVGGSLPLRLEAPASQIIISNPAAADVTVQSPTQLTVHGKAAASTTLVILAEDGRILVDRQVVVGGAGGSGKGGIGLIYATGKNVPIGGQRSDP